MVVALSASTGDVLGKFEASKHPLSCMAIARGESRGRMPQSATTRWPMHSMFTPADGVTAFGGGSSLALWDLSSKERRAKYTGHASPACSAAFTPDGRYAVSAADGERHVAVWSTLPPKKPKKAQPAVASLSLEDPAVSIDACQREGEEEAGDFHVAAVSSSGEAYVWECRERDGAAGLATRLLARVRIGDGPTKGAAAGAEECILAVQLQPGSEGEAERDTRRKAACAISFPFMSSCCTLGGRF